MGGSPPALFFHWHLCKPKDKHLYDLDSEQEAEIQTILCLIPDSNRV